MQSCTFSSANDGICAVRRASYLVTSQVWVGTDRDYVRKYPRREQLGCTHRRQRLEPTQLQRYIGNLWEAMENLRMNYVSTCQSFGVNPYEQTLPSGSTRSRKALGTRRSLSIRLPIEGVVEALSSHTTLLAQKLFASASQTLEVLRAYP